MTFTPTAYQPYEFANRRHIGPSPSEMEDMLRVVGAPSLDALIDEVEPSDEGLVIYTSGSTAQPKGVLHSQRTPVLQAWRFRDFLDFGPEDRVYTCYPFFWTAGIAMSTTSMLRWT